MPPESRDAFYELVLFPTKACAQLNALYLAAARNALYAQQGRASANDFAAQTRELFQAQTNLMDYFNRTFAGGKWNHFMDQTHIGYTELGRSAAQQPERDPSHRNRSAAEAAALGVAIEGSVAAWPGATNEAVLPPFDVFNQQHRYIDVFNKGKAPLNYSATASAPWILLNATNGTVKRTNASGSAWIGRKRRTARASGEVKISGAGSDVIVKVIAFNPAEPTREIVARLCGRRRLRVH